MGRPLNKKYFGNRNVGTAVTTDDGIGGEGIASVTLGGTNNSTGFTAGLTDISFAAPTLPGGVTAIGSLVLYADGIMVAGQTTFTAAGTGVDGLGAAADTYTGVVQKAGGTTSGTAATFTIVKANTNGVTDYSDITVTITAGGTGYAAGDTIVIDGADIGGVTTTNDLTLTVVGFVTDGTIASVTITNSGSGYVSAPTITLSNGTKGTLTTTAVVTTESGVVGTAGNNENAITMTAFLTGGSALPVDIIRQVSTDRYKVTDGTRTGIVKLKASAIAAAGEATIVATDAAAGTYYVTKLTAHKATLTRGTGTVYVDGAATPWTFGTADATYCKLPNA